MTLGAWWLVSESGEVHARWSRRDQDDDVGIVLYQWLDQQVECLAVKLGDVSVLDGLMVVVQDCLTVGACLPTHSEDHVGTQEFKCL